MSKFKHTEFEQEMNIVLKHQDETLSSIHFPSEAQTDSVISKAEELLRLLGKDPQDVSSLPVVKKTPMEISIPTWGELVKDAEYRNWIVPNSYYGTPEFYHCNIIETGFSNWIEKEV